MYYRITVDLRVDETDIITSITASLIGGECMSRPLKQTILFVISNTMCLTTH